jgi:hypothetical protein
MSKKVRCLSRQRSRQNIIETGVVSAYLYLKSERMGWLSFLELDVIRPNCCSDAR